MRASFYRFLLLCLMLALPLQGFAAATMLSCALGHGTAPVTAEALPPCHQDEQPDSSPARHDCAHCALCMLASALPLPAAVSLPADPAVQVFVARAPTAMANHLPDGPERPPRPRFA